MADRLGEIEHLVVLMLENRSFDSLLGYLYRGTSRNTSCRATGANPSTAWPAKSARPFNLPNPRLRSGPGNPRVHVHKAAWKRQRDVVLPYPDPGEAYPHVNHQLFGDPLARPAGVPTMSGFVADYVLAVAQHRRDGKPVEREVYETIMHCYPAPALPVLNGLAWAFAVCDEWFCSVPTQTFPNRSFLHSGASHGFVLNSPPTKWLQNTEPTIFNVLSANGLDRRVSGTVRISSDLLPAGCSPPL